MKCKNVSLITNLIIVVQTAFYFMLFSPHQASLNAAENPMVGSTFCNPLNLDYNFQNKVPDWRQAADPDIFVFKGDYYLFASKSAGYWWSQDMDHWHFVKPEGLDLEKYAPAVFNIGDKVYYTASGCPDIYETEDPKQGKWKKVGSGMNWGDPAVLVDDDKKVYAYFGSAAYGTVFVVQLDPENRFAVMGKPIPCLKVDAKNHGFENRGDNNERTQGGTGTNAPWIEGPWMNKIKGKYYLQYAVPATEERSYADGCYVSDSPTGPFEFCTQSPISFKPLGFVTGLGHGATFADLQGKFWHIDCVTISRLMMFERRLAVFPAAIDRDGMLHCDTCLADYPQYLPGKAPKGAKDNLVPNCMLLSYGKKTEATSSLPDHPPSDAVDENMATWWSAKTADPGESLTVDLGHNCDVSAIQANFAEQDAQSGSSDRSHTFSIRYKVEGASNAHGPFVMLFDKSQNDKDQPHDYVPLKSTRLVRFVRITNEGPMPAGGKFAIRDLRIFGNAHGELPSPVADFTVNRSKDDPRSAAISWKPVPNADGYIIRFGIAPDKLYNHYQIWGGDASSNEIHSLNVDVPAYFTIDVYNSSGLVRGTVIKK